MNLLCNHVRLDKNVSETNQFGSPCFSVRLPRDRQIDLALPFNAFGVSDWLTNHNFSLQSPEALDPKATTSTAFSPFDRNEIFR